MRTHCQHGHEFTPENTYSRSNGYFDCRKCIQWRSEKYQASRLPRVRTDALAETTEYADDGCDLHGHCLTCPFSKCRYDDGTDVQSRSMQLRAARWAYIWDLHKKGIPSAAIARQFHCSERTVYRAIQADGVMTGHHGENDEPGKPVSNLTSIYKKPRPLPVMRENQR